MKELKAVVDPNNLLNPGVIINEDKLGHLKNLKEMPSVEAEVDKCMECGYCEHVCPSRDITLTPRRRIVVRRELAKLKATGKKEAHDELLNQYQYDGMETCAVDGLCASACPVDINTGDLIKRLRRESHSRWNNETALKLAKNFKLGTQLVNTALNAGTLVNKVFGNKTMFKVTRGVKNIIPATPLWSAQLKVPGPIFKNEFQPEKSAFVQSVVYFPTCITRMMGGSASGKKNLVDTFLSVSAKASINVIIAENVKDMCCGQLFSSKGYQKAYIFTVNQTIDRLWQQTEEGKLPVVIDVSSCTHVLQNCAAVLNDVNKQRFIHLKIIDSIVYLRDFLIPALTVRIKKPKIVLHPVCSLQKMGLYDEFRIAAQHFASEVIVPLNAGCCGMAGDRGFLFPELVNAATAPEATEVKSCGEAHGYYSSAKTCEMALSEAVGKNYESILYLADECT
jgi:D-lactate dehydrogenase